MERVKLLWASVTSSGCGRDAIRVFATQEEARNLCAWWSNLYVGHYVALYKIRVPWAVWAELKRDGWRGQDKAVFWKYWDCINPVRKYTTPEKME